VKLFPGGFIFVIVSVFDSVCGKLLSIYGKYLTKVGTYDKVPATSTVSAPVAL
jgi:hypothetical protein